MYNTKKSIAYYHLPGLFEFYELYREFLPLFRRASENIFMTGVRLARYTEHRQTVSGVEDVPVSENRIRKKFWH